MDDADAFSFLDEGEGEAVFFFLARRTMDAEVAVDLTAETFAVAWRLWRTLRSLGPEQRRAWLFTVARRLHARYVRRARVIQVPSLHRDDLALIEERCGLGELRAATHACRRGSTATQRSAAPPVLNGADFLGAAGFGADVAAGQTLSRTIGGFGPALASGVTRGTMTLRYSTGPSLDGALPTAKVRVGSFAVKVP